MFRVLGRRVQLGHRIFIDLRVPPNVILGIHGGSFLCSFKFFSVGDQPGYNKLFTFLEPNLDNAIAAGSPTKTALWPRSFHVWPRASRMGLAMVITILYDKTMTLAGYNQRTRIGEIFDKAGFFGGTFLSYLVILILKLLLVTTPKD